MNEVREQRGRRDAARRQVALPGTLSVLCALEKTKNCFHGAAGVGVKRVGSRIPGTWPSSLGHSFFICKMDMMQIHDRVALKQGAGTEPAGG